MPDLREQLIAIYAKVPAKDAPATAEYQQLCAENIQPSQRANIFNEERNAIEQAKRRLEERLDKKPASKQVGAALEELFRRRGERDRDRCHELIVQGYRPFWLQPQQDYFDAGAKLVILQYDFFLSFTKRYPPPAAENPVNERYRHFIRKVLGAKKLKTSDMRKNLLAEAVYQLLSEGSRRGFFFPHNQYDNTVTEPKLEEALGSSLFFIQLVQNIMFEKPQQPGKNYCFFEYDKCWSALPDESRLLFVVAEPEKGLLASHRVPVDYDNWHIHIGKKDPPYLAQVDQLGAKQGVHLSDIFRTKVISLVEKYWENLFQNAPA